MPGGETITGADAAIPARLDGRASGLLVVWAVLFLAIGGYFATVQNVWVDETTQMLGSALPVRRLLAWLAGGYEPLGVPPDRMPPVSYLIDALCQRTLCTGVGGFRVLHLVIACAGVLVVLGLVARRFGVWAVVIAGALLTLPPQMTTYAVEIRAYPLFFAAVAVALTLFFRLYDTPALRLPRLAAFTAMALVVVYTHFFGLVAACALFTALVLTRAGSLRELVAIVACWLVLLALSLGLVPLIVGAASVGSAPADVVPVGAGDIAVYALRLFGHAAMFLWPPLAAVYFAALAVLTAVSLWRIARAFRWSERADPLLGVIVALAAGLIVTILAAFVLHMFNPLAPNYSLWMWPLIVVLVASAARPAAGADRLRWVVRAGAVVLVAALATMAAIFLRSADWFVHGPERAMVAELDRSTGPTAVVFTDTTWGFGYFPLVFRRGLTLPQYLLDDAGRLHPIGIDSRPDRPPVPIATLDRYRRLLVVAIELRTYRDLSALWRHRIDATALVGPRPNAGVLNAWPVTRSAVIPGMYASRLDTLEKR